MKCTSWTSREERAVSRERERESRRRKNLPFFFKFEKETS
jgi:hypothetical protein